MAEDGELELTQREVDEVIRSLSGLREDQKSAMRCLGQLIAEIKASPERLAMGVFWVGEKDLLGDVQITWLSNMNRGGIEKIVRHAYQRICKGESSGDPI